MLRRKHFTPPLVSALYARDPPTNRPPTHARTETAAEAISGYRYNNNMPACAAQPPTHPPLTSAQVKRITAPPQTLHPTPRGSPALTGPTHHHAHPSHTRMTHSPRAYPHALSLHLLLLSAVARARPCLAADFAPRTPNESMPRRKHFTPPLVSALHARDQPTTRPPTRARTEPAGAGSGSRPRSSPHHQPRAHRRATTPTLSQLQRHHCSW